MLDCDLNTDDGAVDTVTVAIASESEPDGELVVLTETDVDSADFLGTIPLSETDGPGVLWVSPGETVTATYVDADDGMGGVDVAVTAAAVVDCAPPEISNVILAAAPGTITVRFDTHEPTIGTLRFGTSCDALSESTSEGSLGTSHTFQLAELEIGTLYFLSLGVEDQAGNTASDDNAGECYTFLFDGPNFFTELFDEDDNDLDHLSITFTPNGSADFYEACVEPILELPTDPAGGSIMGMGDNSALLFALGGETVRLYGQSYNAVMAISNGYLNFPSDDGFQMVANSIESLVNHFGQPTVSGLFDDLDPSVGGTVSRKLLDDRVAVTWEDVPEFGTSNANTFQIEMFFDGRIRLSYLGIDATDGLAGLSQGATAGIPPGYSETDLSASGSCFADFDFDGDGDIDLDDFAAYLDCYTGPNGGPAGPECVRGDSDGDEDVDFADFWRFELAFTGNAAP